MKYRNVSEVFSLGCFVDDREIEGKCETCGSRGEEVVNREGEVCGDVKNRGAEEIDDHCSDVEVPRE